MRSFRLCCLFLLLLPAVRAADPPFEIRAGDRVLLLGDTLLEREGTYGYLETRMHEQFADRPFTVRNLSWAGDTPRGVARASFDPPAAGFDRLQEQIARVRPTVVFLGYGMAASLQQLTEESHDPTLNADPARYGAEPMTAARFKKELGELMDAIEKGADGYLPAKAQRGAEEGRHRAVDAPASGTNGAVPSTPSADLSKTSAPLRSEKDAAPGARVRFVLLSPIRHEDLRAERPGLPDPAEHNKLLAEYSKAIEELAQERRARFCYLGNIWTTRWVPAGPVRLTDNGIHLNQIGYSRAVGTLTDDLGWGSSTVERAFLDEVQKAGTLPDIKEQFAAKLRASDSLAAKTVPLNAAIIRKNELFFHQFRPANWTYILGFRKHEQGQNAIEMPQFDPLIAAAEAEIEKLKKAAAGGIKAIQPTSPEIQTTPAPAPPLPLPTFTVADGYQIELWAQNPLLEKPTQMNWDAAGRLWVSSSSLYPQIAPGQLADDKILILSDPEKTGQATKSEVFAKGLLMPTGVVPDLAFNIEHLAFGKDAAAPSGEKNPPREAPTSQMLNAKSSMLNASACYVGQSTELLHIDAAGRRRIVLSGFGTEDTHHMIHTLRWGPDGRLYFHQSIYIHSHLETPWGMVRLNSGGCLAYDPRTERTEVFFKGLANPWGHAWDRWGQSFFTDGAGDDGISWAFPGATLVTSERARQFMPSISPGSYPKFCGLELIYSPHFPADWQGHAVTCDFRAHRVVRFAITDLAAADGGHRAVDAPPPGTDGAVPSSRPLSSGYVTTALPDLVRTDDASFRPIDVKLGPDGALYVADWSNPIINHGEVDFRDPRRDHHSGRIWRISKKGEPKLEWAPLVKQGGNTLQALLVRTGSLWEKEQARRVLQARDRAAWATDVEKVPAALAEIGNLEFAWGDQATQRVNPARVEKLFTANEPNVRAAAIRLTIPWYFGIVDMYKGLVKREEQKVKDAANPGERRLLLPEEDPAVGSGNSEDPMLKLYREGVIYWDDLQPFARAVADPNPRVRLEAMRALAHIPTARSAELVLDAVMKAPPNDPYYRHAAWLSINDLALPWTEAIASGAWKSEGHEAQLEFGLKALPPDLSRDTLARVLATGKTDLATGPWIELIRHSGGPDELRRIYEMLLVSFGTDCCPDQAIEALPAAPVNEATARRILTALLEAARLRDARPGGDLATLERLLLHTTAAIRADSARLVGYWKPAGGLRWLETALADTHPPLDPEGVQHAIESVRDFGGAPAIALLKKLTADSTPAPRRQQAAAALAALDLGGSLPDIAAAISAAPTEDAALTAWREVFKITGAVETVTARLTTEPWGQTLAPSARAAGLRAAYEAGKKGEKLVAFFQGPASPPGAPADYLALAELVKKDGDPARGEFIYRRAANGCVACHAIGGAGGEVGPALTSLGASAPLDYIIESVLQPAAKIKEGYNAVTLSLQDGTEISGIDVRETERERFIRTVSGQEIGVVKTHITGRTYGTSIMPAGLLDSSTDQERRDLFAFLGALGKPGPFDASKPHVARAWKLYPGTAKDAALQATLNDATATVFTLVDGRLTKAQLTDALQLVNNPGETIYAVTQFQSSGPTSIALTNSQNSWIDGKEYLGPNSINLPAGLHTLTIQHTVKSLPDFLQATSPEASFLTK